MLAPFDKEHLWNEVKFIIMYELSSYFPSAENTLSANLLRRKSEICIVKNVQNFYSWENCFLELFF